MKDEDYIKATECCKTLDCENCPIKEKDYCQELLDFEKYKRDNQHQINTLKEKRNDKLCN